MVISTEQVLSVIKPLADVGVTVPGSEPVTEMLLHPVIVPSVVFSSVAVTVETVYPPIKVIILGLSITV